MKPIAIIPARGGSKRIPNKNIKSFFGKAIISYSIKTALESNLFERIIVSTDSEEIAKTAKNNGAEVPFFRSQKNSDDTATTADALNEVFNQLGDIGYDFDLACCIYPTAPLIIEEDLIKGKALLEKEKFDSVFSAVEFSYPIWRGLKIENQKTSMLWPKYKNTNSQNLQSAYHDAGQWYWYYAKRLNVTSQLFTENSGSIILPPTRVQDIDTLSDWSIAELKYRLLTENNG